MKCLKVDDYVKRTTTLKDIGLLQEELESYLKNGPGPQARMLCDRVIRACNSQLGDGPHENDHISLLIKLVESALHGYDVSGKIFETQSSPLYMEKIIFHIVKKLSSLGVHRLSSHLAGLLYSRLAAAQQTEDYCVLVRSCFAILWNGLSTTKDGPNLNSRDKYHCQMQALSFLLLLDKESTVSSSHSKVLMYTEDALAEFGKGCVPLTQEDASFLIKETKLFLAVHWTRGEGGEENEQSVAQTCSPTLSEVVLILAKILCKAHHWDLASSFVDEIQTRFGDCVHCLTQILVLGRWVIKIHRSMSSGDENSQAFTECARALRSVPGCLGNWDAHAILEGCSLVVWAVEAGQNKGLSGPTLLSWFSFLEEYQELILKRLQKDVTSQTEGSRLQQSLCISMYQGFVFAYESMLASKLESTQTMDRVSLYCQATAGRMMTELRKLSSDVILTKAVTAVSNLVCGLYNRRLYDQAFTLVEILCQELSRNCPPSLPVDKLSRAFMLAVQCSRRGGQLERALDWVILWLKTLGQQVSSHMAEPIALWVKTKVDAARSGEEDIRLRTLRDGFGLEVPDEEVMICLLGEELRAYKEVAGDTTQERYNTLCDLLDICHEESSHTHLRAVYLCEMAQVVCFQDFSEQTDCSAVDFTHEALRLLEEEPETAENADRLKDDKAHGFLWLFICTLENNLQKAMDSDKKLQDLREQGQCVANPVGTNDLDYEDKQKQQDSTQVYDSLHFNLDAENKLCQPLDKALALWSSVLSSEKPPPIRNPKQTCSSLGIIAALYSLMGKPLLALEAYQLALGLSCHLGDAQGCATSLCQSARLLLELGVPGLAQAKLEQAEKFLTSDATAEGPSPLSVLAVLLRAQYCYSTGQVTQGVPYLCDVLKEVNEQRQTKSWYLLRARALQTCSAYLSLDTEQLPQALRRSITQHGLRSPDTALSESLKLLCSLLVTLVGRGLYGTFNSNPDKRFVDHGENLLLKWQLLSEVLGCSLKMVTVRRNSGAVHEAKLQCLEALKLATKLQTLSQCAELLVVKAELELMKGEREECGFDLDKVRNLLEFCTDFSNQEPKVEVKIKPRKGRPARKPKCSPPANEDDCKDILSSRWLPKDPVERDQTSSPPLKVRAVRWLSSLDHEASCQCPFCSEPGLGRVTARWAATQADLALLQGPTEARVSRKLFQATLARCKSVTAKVGGKLAKVLSINGTAKSSLKPSLMQDIVGRVYLCMALSGLELRLDKGIGSVLDAGLAFLSSKLSPELRPLRASLQVTKAIVSLLTLAAQKDCTPEDLFSATWTWNAPKTAIELESQPITLPSSALLKKSREPVVTMKNTTLPAKTKETTNPTATAPRVKLSSSSSKVKSLIPMTPVMVKPAKTKWSAQELSTFDFDTDAPKVASTPAQRVRATPSAQKGAAKATPRLQFHVYEELSPPQEKVHPVPAAPKRLRKNRFKVQFSDESDTEADPQAERKAKREVTGKRTAAPRAARHPKAAPETCAEKAPLKAQAKPKRGTALPRSSSSTEEESLMAARAASATKGRTRRQPARTDEETGEEPEKMRTIQEELEGILDMSVELLRASDTEAEENVSSNTNFEVLRRDLCGDLEKHYPGVGLQANLSASHTELESLSVEAVQSLLRSAWLALQHFPPPTLFPRLCALLALTTGQEDPVTTAMLHTQSLGVTCRHHMIRHIASRLRKLRKISSELAEKMDSLSLDEPSARTGDSTEQRLTQLERIFAFPAMDSPSFPQQHCQEFIQQIQQLPNGVTVCVLSVMGVKAGEMGDTVLLSRLEKGSAPLTVHIPTSHQQHPISWLVQEMDSIQKEQKAVSCVSEKAKWWEGRRALDARVERLLEEMDDLLGCWRSFLLPLSADPEVGIQAKHLHKALSAKGVKTSEEMLKVVLSASPSLSKADQYRLALGLSPQSGDECKDLVQKAVSRLADRDEPHGHIVLILDKYLQKLPWESTSSLKSCSVTRMPSLHSLLGHCIQKEADPQCVLKKGVNTKEVFYLLNPDGNLGDTQERFKEWFSSRPDWQGVCGSAPASDQLQEAVATKDLYIYVGHGAGARFLDGQMALKQDMRAASLLFGCSSAALSVRGDLEGAGIVLNYIMAGCPLVLGNLWDVTDRDIDRFTKALLASWLSAGAGAPLLDHMGPSRLATHLKHLIGAAPVVYGLPIHLQ